jgi:hypothetical protein
VPSVRFALAIAFGSLVACAPLPHTRSAGAVTSLAVRPVAWNPANAAVGTVRSVADAGDVVCVFADEGATIFSSSAVVGRDDAAKDFVDGGAILASDGKTRWVVGVDSKGTLWRLRGMSAFEDVGARYGLAGKKFRSAVLLDPGTIGFGLDRELAVAREQKTSLYPTSAFKQLAGGAGFAVGVGKDAVDVVNTTNGRATRFALLGATGAALDGKGRLFATTRRALYAGDLDGSLALVYDAGAEDIHGLVVSNDRVWFADGVELGIVDGNRVAETVGINIPREATLKGSPSGDVWVVGGGKLLRFEALVGDAPSPSASLSTTWSRTIAPVFARSCAECHRPNGVSEIDLSTEAAWNEKKTEIRARVITKRTMPPDGHPLSDADRAAVRAWVERN